MQPLRQRAAWLHVCILTALAAATEWAYKDRYACGVCLDILASPDPSACSHYGACNLINHTDNCRVHCGTLSKYKPNTTTFDLRVTKGFGTKPYGSLRISVVTREGQALDFNATEFDYSAPFQFRWTGNTLSTKMVEVPEGRSQITIGSRVVQLSLPKESAGVAGVLIADPCIRSGSFTSLVACRNAKRFGTAERTPALLNMFVGDDDMDFWGILGDNFYDRNGETTSDIFDKLTVETKSKIMLTVPGNHDYWVLGSPYVSSKSDQFGNGHMQWYPQDTKASEHITPGDTTAPYNFSVDPNSKRLPAIQNSFYYNSIGNIGIIGYSGAYSLNQTLPYMREACAWLGKKYATGQVQIGMLVGHWDVPVLGCAPEMAGPQFYDQMAKLPGCDTLSAQNNLKFFMGHTHCNLPHPHGKAGAGFMVAGQGMEGCGNYGIPVIDTTESRVRVWYFDVYSLSGQDNYDVLKECLLVRGWRRCTMYATLWLDQAL